MVLGHTLVVDIHFVQLNMRLGGFQLPSQMGTYGMQWNLGWIFHPIDFILKSWHQTPVDLATTFFLRTYAKSDPILCKINN